MRRKRFQSTIKRLGFRGQLQLEPLESRMLMDASGAIHGAGCGCSFCGGALALPTVDVAPDLPVTYSSGVPGDETQGPTFALTGIPVLNSLVGATATIYLNFLGKFDSFWGSYSNITSPAYDTDNDPTSFSAGELSAISSIWAQVAEDYSPFNVNVTTVAPPSFANKVAIEVVIGGNGSWTGGTYGGVAYVDAFTSGLQNVAYVFSQNLGGGAAKYVGEAISHEAGHTFGLQHQSSYVNGVKTAEYSTGNGDGTAPIMGNSYYATRGLWSNSTTTSSITFQDDMAVLSRTANGFGYRADDHGNAFGSGTTLVASNNQVSSSGVLTSVADTDYFTFTTGAGQISFSVSVPTNVNNLDSVLELRDSNGNLVLQVSPSNSFNATFTTTVAAGTYSVVVASSGGYGNVGQYTLSGTIQPEEVVTLTIAAPTNLAANLIASGVSLTWQDNANNETVYWVIRSANGGTTWTTLAGLNPNSTTYTDTTAPAGGTYYYLVCAGVGEEISDWSNTDSVTLAPGAPTGLTATAAAWNTINLAWNDCAGETGYRIERSGGGAGWTQIATVGTNVTSYSSSGLTASTSYYYRIFAENEGGSSAASLASTATTLAPPAPVAPTNLASSYSNGTVSLTWQDNANNETVYYVSRSQGGSTWTTIATLGANAQSYADTTGSLGGTYSYRVCAENGPSLSSWSNTETVTLTLVAPSNLNATAQSWNTVNLTWTDSYGENSYRIDRSLDGQTWSMVTTVAANSTSYQNTGLAGSTTYTYRVAAQFSGGLSAISSTAQATTPVAPAPIGPSSLVANYVGGVVNIAWQDNAANETNYYVIRSSDAGATWTTIAWLGADAKSFVDTNVAEGATYRYLACCAIGDVLAWSNQATVNITFSPPTNLAANYTSGRVNLTWKDNSSLETIYYVIRSADAGATWTTIAYLAANSTSFADTTAATGSTYSYLVCGGNAQGELAWSNKQSLTIAPSAPAGLAATATSWNTISLTWTDTSGEAGYRIERSTNNKNWTQVADLAANTTSYVNSGVSAKTKYYYRAVAYNTGGNSGFSNVAILTTPSAPTIPTAPTSLVAKTAGPNQVNLTWTDRSGNEQGFYIERSSNNGQTWQQIGQVQANIKAYADTTVSAATAYQYRVRAFNEAGASGYSNKPSVTTPAQAAAFGSAIVSQGNPATATPIRTVWLSSQQAHDAALADAAFVGSLGA